MKSNGYRQEPWNLDALFSDFDAPEMKAAHERLEEGLAAFEAYRESLIPGLDIEEFLEILSDYEMLTRIISRIYGYSSLRFAADTQDQSAQASLASVQALVASAENRTLFFELWWKNLGDENAHRLLKASGDYRYWLANLRLKRPFTLTEAEERVINLKDVNGPSALLTLLSTITDRYTFKLLVDGKERELTRDELAVYFRHSDSDLRQRSYQELFRVYERDKVVLGQIYQYRVRDWDSENVSLRGYSSPLAVRNLANDIPNEVVQLLLDSCRSNAPIFRRYFQLKAKWLGLKKLRRYDIYAPIAESDTKVEFADAVDLVLTSFRRFEPRVADLAERVFVEHHLDSEIRPGKTGGAFCATITPELTPWLLQSYQGRPDDVATLAHELGHAIHSMLAANHTALTQQSSLPLAETASTFGEMLVVDRLLAESSDPATRRDLLFRQMDNNYGTILRQAYFALFEQEAHEKIKAGATIDELTALYAQNLADQFGDAVEISDEFNLEWIVIPHIYHVPFYVYAYAFGQLLVLSLYQQYLEEGESFKPRYIDLLTAGGSASPAQLLEKAGIDMHSAEFWQGGFDVLSSAVDELEKIEVVQPQG